MSSLQPAAPDPRSRSLGRGARRTAVFVIGTIVLILSLAYLVYGGIQQGATYWVTVSELQQRAPGTLPARVRLGGTVQPGTIRWDASHRHLTFMVTDGQHALPVAYSGVVPDIFAEGRQVVVEGTRDPGGTFQATTLLAKCPTKYNAADPAPSQ
ncbi:MAG TPA: cytochrome c maturation protein CcmE [bacterium]|nr:cytochrome c maturation protein CcmE [bacterium]